MKAEAIVKLHFDQVTDEVLASARAGVGIAGERLLALAVDLAPRDNGDLAGSGSVSTPLSQSDPTVEVVFDMPYAARLHEHPEYNFSTESNPKAQGKYLENAGVQNKAELLAIVEKQIAGRANHDF